MFCAHYASVTEWQYVETKTSSVIICCPRGISCCRRLWLMKSQGQLDDFFIIVHILWRRKPCCVTSVLQTKTKILVGIIHGLLKHCNTAAKSRNVQFTKIIIENITKLQTEWNIRCILMQATNLWQKNIKKSTKTCWLD